MVKKNVLFLLLFLSLGIGVSNAALVSDFDSDNLITTSDIAIFIAWKTEFDFSVKDPSYLVTFENVDIRASNILPASEIVVRRLPIPSVDKLADRGDNPVADDIAYMLAFVVENNFAIKTGTQVKFENVAIRASQILTLKTNLGKLPGGTIGDSTIPVTITGIQLDP